MNKKHRNKSWLLAATLSVMALTPLHLATAEHWTERYDIEWNAPSKDVTGNMPVGAGDMACNVWVEKATGDLMFYIQRSGSFTEIGEHIKLGRIRVQLEPNPLKDCTSFSQRLILKDGYISIRAEGSGDADFETRIKLWVDQFNHSVNISIDADKPVSWKAAYESWRTEDKTLEDDPQIKASGKLRSPRWGSYQFVHGPVEVVKLKDEGFRFENGSVLFYHRNPAETMSPDYGLKQQGLEKYKDQLPNINKYRTMGGRLFANNALEHEESAGTYYKTDFKSLVLKSKAPARQHTLHVATHIAQRENLTDWMNELNATCDAVRKTGGDYEKNKAWWNAFWERSHIVIHPDKKDESSPLWQIGRNYNLVRYMVGGNAYGEFPTKFNGGNLTFDERQGYDPDWRRWGGDFFTAQNQRLIYWPMLRSGDFDMMPSMFHLLELAHAGSKIRVEDAFGHGGMMISENVHPTGIHIPFSYGWKEAGNKYERGPDLKFGDPGTDATFIPRGKPILRGLMVSPSVTYYYHSQLEFSYMMLMYHIYSGESFEQYMPFINDSLRFYDEHYQARQKFRNGKTLDENGKLYIFPSQALESYKGNVANPVEVVAGLRACLNTLLSLELPYISPEDKQYYRELLERVPEMPFGQLEGHRVMRPAEVYTPKTDGRGKEAPQYYPLFPYNMYSLLDDEIETFQNTWKYDRSIRYSHVSWHQNGIFLARMGKVEEAFEFHYKKLGDTTTRDLRFPTYWGPGYDGIPDHNWGGSGMIGLQEMLMQCIGDKILILPCWDPAVDVDFKLHAPGKTVVEVSFRNGKIQDIQVTPEHRKKDVVMMN